MLHYINFFNQRIQFLRSNGDQLLSMLKIRIIRHEQIQNEWIYSLTKHLLKMLAEIKTCEYFKMEKQLVYLNDDDLYKITFAGFFKDLVRQFNLKLKAKRQKRLNHFQLIDNIF